ncbi:RGS1-HXK1-interacting protein 1 [Castanea sativa]|uniref:RGS1-HXK1-interacting protein 1 n=1 Tax=Castanea sativa TaxID=21020 RepID=UPI003F64A5F7
MATVAESSEANPIPPLPPPPTPSPSEGHSSNNNNNSAKTLDETTTLWVEYAVQQAQLYQKAIEGALDSALEVSRSRLSQIRSTSSAHFNQTIDSLQDLKSDYATYEDLLVGKIKEGVVIASSHPLITGGVAAGLGLIVLKRPRRFLYYKTLRLFASEESLLSRADSQVKELRQSIDLLKAESEKLEKRALHGEEELLRGRTKLRQAGKQIQGVIRSAYKIERQAGGLKDILGELPRTQASRFRSQVSKLASEAKRERTALTKEVTKISNYGISV